MNESRSSWRPLIIAAMMAVDVLIIFDAFALAYLLRFRLFFLAYTYLQAAPVQEYLKAMVVVAYFWVLLFYIFGLYDYTRTRSWIDTIHLVIKAVSFGTIIILSLTYFYRDFSFSRLVCVYAWMISIILFSVFRLAINLFRADWYRSGRNLRKIIIVGSRTLARYMVQKINMQPELGLEVTGIMDSTPPDTAIPGGEYLGNLSELDRHITARHVDGVLIAHPALGHYELLEIIQICERKGISIRMVPPTYDLLINYRDLEEVDGIPLVKINEQMYRRFQDLFKRAFDLLVSSLLLILTAPLWGIIATLIRKEDGGAVFFSQQRVGKDGRIFSMLKFRTMVINAEVVRDGLVDIDKLAEPVYKIENDPRVTAIGRFLRRTSLDELPQLINVILGHMSLVGPRPEEEKLVSRYNVWERRRLKALPGITGLQQVKCRGNGSLSERVKWDMVYVRKRSVFLDLWILLQTVWVVITGKGAQ